MNGGSRSARFFGALGAILGVLTLVLLVGPSTSTTTFLTLKAPAAGPVYSYDSAAQLSMATHSASAAVVLASRTTGMSAAANVPATRPAAASGFAANGAIALSRPSSRVLGANLEAAGFSRPAGSAAHHIVAGSSAKATEARAVLQRFGIDINDAGNGVFLPGRMTSPNPTGAAVHSRIHTNAYYSEVNSLLGQATTRTDALDALAYIRSQLLSGGFP